MPKILIAEDERDIRELITFTLKFAGYDVVTAKNGAEAVQTARDAKPDLILLDVRMPIMTGFEACVAIKGDPGLNHIPVVFLSAKGQDAEINEGMTAGAIDYILKPFSPDQLTSKVTDLLKEG